MIKSADNHPMTVRVSLCAPLCPRGVRGDPRALETEDVRGGEGGETLRMDSDGRKTLHETQICKWWTDDGIKIETIHVDTKKMCLNIGVYVKGGKKWKKTL